jgi:hypothetical protein
MYPAWGGEGRVASGRDGNARVAGLVTRSTAKGQFVRQTRATALDGGGHPAAASQKGVLRAPVSQPRALARGGYRCAPTLPSSAVVRARAMAAERARRAGGARCRSKKIAKRTQSRRQESWRNWHGEMPSDTAYCAGISFTAWPSAATRRARWWAPHDAAMPIRHGGRFASYSTSCGRGSRRLASTWPRPSMATVSHAVLPRSIPWS